MLDQHPEAVVHDVPLRLVAPGDTLLLTATLRYEASDPYAVEATFRAGDEAISWVLGRDLLRDGLEAESGEGDVHVWPTDEDADPLDDEDGADVVALSRSAAAPTTWTTRAPSAGSPASTSRAS
ncbi:hypothetical protein GCM10025868_04670 [Angustibacter aerolatus]|uniref:SsgA family sporulation/cell division regulator n=1 Tax=Angustibacter aerolatus TaxID=1162965 RepID=A0ABQ6JE86_9ACTN|nr:SsgA family sporulation/cell division regulator [Angustibacter aerolatus]GMA85217.1 hypothetical protein GCM10025868_04670 [Angustibacter aerolatus]